MDEKLINLAKDIQKIAESMKEDDNISDYSDSSYENLQILCG